MFAITEQFAVRVRDNVRTCPLREGETRRVKGLGETYIALVATNIDDSIYDWLFTVRIDDADYNVLRCHHDDR